MESGVFSLTAGSRFSNAGLSCSFAFIGVAQIISYGRLDSHALILLVLGIGTLLWTVFVSDGTAAWLKKEWLVLVIVAMILSALASNPLTYADSEWARIYPGIAISVALLVASYLSPLERTRGLAMPRFLALVTVAIVMRAAVPVLSPSPGEDVWVVQQEAAGAVSDGVNPYQYPYTQIFSAEFYEYLGYASGFHYTPLALIPVVPSYLLAGDIRWAYVLCELSALFLLWKLLSQTALSREKKELLLLCWGLNPIAMLVIEHSWSEPVLAALVALFALLRRRRMAMSAAVCLAALFSYKQYMFLLAPLLLFLPGAGAALIVLVGLNVIVYAPWMVLGMGDVIANVTQPLRSSPRSDALSFAALWINLKHAQFPAWVNAAAVLGAFHFAKVNLARDLSGLIASLAVVLSLFFATAKQAFCNYYYLVLFLILLLLVLQQGSEDSPRTNTLRAAHD